MEPPSPTSGDSKTANEGEEDRDSDGESQNTLTKTSSRLDDSQINQLNL